MAISPGPLTLDVYGPTKQSLSSFYEAVNLTGTAARTANEGGVEFSGATILGEVVNNATIHANGDFVEGLTFSSDVLSRVTLVGGNIVHAGTMNLTGTAAKGIVLGNMNGLDVINKGTINVTGLSQDQINTVRGIELAGGHVWDIVNESTINVKSNGGEGIGVYTPPEGLSSIDGSITNKGNINVTGDHGRGVSVNGANFHGSIANNGNINVFGLGGEAISIEDTNYRAIENTGAIHANGENGIGINVKGAFGLASEDGGEGIVNSGVITADDTAIKINSNDATYDFYVTQNSGVIQGKTAIDGNNQTIFNFNGGTVHGDLKGLKQVNVDGNAAFNGNEIQATLVDVKTGRLYLGKLSTNVTGDLTVRNLAELQLRLSDSTDPSKAVANVSGTATFESGSKITLTAQAGDYKEVDGTKYTLVKAGNLVDNGLSVESASALIRVRGFNVKDGQITAVVGAAETEEVTNDVKLEGASQNAAHALVPFADSVLKNLPTDSTLYQEFVNADAPTLARLAEQLAPDVNGGARVAAQAASRLTNNATTSRARSVGDNSGDVLTQTGVWVKVLTADATQDTRNQVAGFDADSNGIIIGADGKVNDETTVGLAYSYVKSDVDSDNGNKLDVDTHTLTAYAGWENGPISVDGSISYGLSDNDSKRYIGSTTAKSNYDSDLLAIDLTAGYTFAIDSQLNIEPVIGARYSNVKIDGFTEKGSEAALTTGSQRLETAELGFGVRADAAYAFGEGTLKPQASIMTYHDFAQDETSTTSAYVLGGNTFLSSGASPNKESYEANLGLDYSVGSVTFGASYDYLRKTDFHADAYSLRARYDF